MEKIRMMEHKNIIDCLASQLDALLELIKFGVEEADAKSIAVTSEMAQTILQELMTETEDIVNEWKAAKCEPTIQKL